jgi:hypothetical protein
MAVPTAASRYGWGGLAARIVLTLVGAAGLIVGAFMKWAPGTTGTTGSKLIGVDLTGRALVQTTFRDSNSFVSTVGFGVIVLGLLAIVGLAFRSGWLTRLVGAVGIAGFVLFVIEVYRANLTVTDVGVGAWMCLGGALVALIAGFLGTRPGAVSPTTPTLVQ